METKANVRKRIMKPLPVILPPVVAILLYAVFSSRTALANFAARYFSRPVKRFLGMIFSIVPLSVMEIMYVAAAIWLVWFIVMTVIKVVKYTSDDTREEHGDTHRKVFAARLRILAKRAGILILVILYIFGAYLCLFGIDYKSDSFETMSGIEVDKISVEELYSVAEYFMSNAVRLSDTVERDSEGHFVKDIDSLLSRSTSIYSEVYKEFDCISCTLRTPKKMLLFSYLSSMMGFTGVYFPFTGESNINIDAPACLIPFTIGHELAHQSGVYAEQEANFLGIAACISSGEDDYIYSGYLAGSIYLMNALYSADKDLWRELKNTLTGSALIDWNDNHAYWQSFESQVTEVSETVYDSYLKANGQKLGMKSYGACVDLLVAYYG